VFDTINTTNISKILFDGDPTIIGLTDVGSDVDTGNAEICLVTANSLERSSDKRVRTKKVYN
jgi:hypothetical protein